MSTNSTSPKPTLEERQAFFKMCESHDWYYEYSDDGRCWRKGREEYERLQTMVAKHEDYKAIYKAWVDYKFSGPHTNTEKKPRPIMPEV